MTAFIRRWISWFMLRTEYEHVELFLKNEWVGAGWKNFVVTDLVTFIWSYQFSWTGPKNNKWTSSGGYFTIHITEFGHEVRMFRSPWDLWPELITSNPDCYGLTALQALNIYNALMDTSVRKEKKHVTQ